MRINSVGQSVRHRKDVLTIFWSDRDMNSRVTSTISTRKFMKPHNLALSCLKFSKNSQFSDGNSRTASCKKYLFLKLSVGRLNLYPDSERKIWFFDPMMMRHFWVSLMAPGTIMISPKLSLVKMISTWRLRMNQVDSHLLGWRWRLYGKTYDWKIYG